MTDDVESAFGFAPPPFRPDEALAGLKRQLRELRLSEREGRFERKGVPIAALEPIEGAIRARVVRRPSRTPEWNERTLRSGADVRRFVEDLKRDLARWSPDDE